jgi:hypothetical protein
MSFRWVANAFVPRTNPRKRAVFGLAVLLAAGCGGGKGRPGERIVRGSGYRFSAPLAWRVVRSGRELQASKGLALVSVTRFPLLRAYRPELFDHVRPELDRAAAGLAAQQQGKIGESRSVTISGRAARTYEIDYSRDGKELAERLTFVLRGKTEYLLLCRYARGGDTGACDRLGATFKLAG